MKAPAAGAPSLRRNFLYSAAYTVLNIAFPLATFGYVSRVMGPEALGRLNVATALAAFFVLVATLAMPLYGAREIAKARDDRARLDAVFSQLFLLNLLTSLVSLLLYAGLCAASGSLRAHLALHAVAGLAILFNAVTVDWLYAGLEDYRFIAWRSLAFKVASFGLLLALVREPGDLILVAAIGVFANAGPGLYGLVASRRRARLGLAPLRSLRPHLRAMSALSASTLVASVYVYLDSVLLGRISGDRAVGLFAAATRVPRVAISVVQSLGAVIIPRFSYYLEHGMEDRWRATARKALAFVWFSALPSAGILAALAPRIVPVLSGPGFEDAIPAMRVAAPLVVLMGFTNFLGLQVLFPGGGERKLLLTTCISAAVNVALNLALMPRFGQTGAAAALIAAEASSAVALASLAAGRRLGFPLADGATLRYAVLAALASAAAWAVSSRPGPHAAMLPLAALAGAAVYLGGLRLLRDPLLAEMSGAFGARLRGLLGRGG